MTNDLYITDQENIYYGPGFIYNGKELNLRRELDNLLFGANDEVKKGRIGFFRYMRRDDNGALIRCSCRDIVTDEPDLDYFCKYCYGHGYLWNDVEIVYYKNDDANRKWGYTIFYFRYDETPTEYDFIVEIERDSGGTPTAPVVVERLYKIDEIEAFRADDGRTEFWRAKATWDRKWSVWTNRYLDNGVQVREPGAAS